MSINCPTWRYFAEIVWSLNCCEAAAGCQPSNRIDCHLFPASSGPVFWRERRRIWRRMFKTARVPVMSVCFACQKQGFELGQLLT